MSRFIVGFLAVACAVTLSAFGQNKVVFDNQSGDPALVKLIGPTKTEVQVPSGAKSGVDATAGKYTIKVRYGTPANYLYSKGQEFEVTETATARSETTITLHKVIAGNYESQAISEAEFGASAEPTLKGAAAPLSAVQNVDAKYDVIEGFLLAAPGTNLGEQLESVLGKDEAKKVVMAMYVDPSCISKGNFTWCPKNVKAGQKVHVFVPRLVNGRITVRSQNQQVWVPDERNGEKLLSPEIILPAKQDAAGSPLLSVRIEDNLGFAGAHGGVDDILILTPKSPKR